MNLTAKKIISILLAALLTVSIIPAEAFAVGGRLNYASAMTDSGGSAMIDEDTKGQLSGYVHLIELHIGDIIGPEVEDIMGHGTIVLTAGTYYMHNANNQIGQNDVTLTDWFFDRSSEGCCFMDEDTYYRYYPYYEGPTDSWQVTDISGDTYTFAGYGVVQVDVPFDQAVTYRHYDTDGTLLDDAILPANSGYAVESETIIWSKDYYIVSGNVTVSNRIKLTSQVVNLILLDGATLTAEKGINVPFLNKLNIFVGSTTGTIEGTGTLIADARNSSGENAGIGGNSDESGGYINIHGGNITAYGKICGASIGGGNNGSHNDIRIYDGTVNAYGGSNTMWGAAGIGAGFGARGGNVYIYGGTVNAKGTGKSAGIGGGGSSGNGGAGGNVYIYGGKVTATGGNNNAMGIGAAQGNSNNGTLTIGDNVTVFTSTDNSTWTDTTSDTSVRTRYMKTEAATVHKHDGITFEPWTSTNSLPNIAGNYYLTADVTIGSTWNVPSNTTVLLCLNGHGIKASGTGYSVVTVNNGSTLHIYDCQPNAAHEPAFTVTNPANNEIVTITGGYIGNGRASVGGGIIVNNNGSCYLHGGSIVGNRATGHSSSGGGNDNLSAGGGVFVARGAAFEMSGGAVSYNVTTTYGGGGLGVQGSAVLSGGRISENCCGTYGSGNSYSKGGGVYVDYSGSFTMNGGTIEGNHARNGGGVAANTGSFVMNGGSLQYNEGWTYNGAAWINSSATTTINGGTIQHNISKDFGFSIMGSNGLSLSGNVVIADNYKTGSAATNGRIINTNGSYSINTEGCTPYNMYFGSANIKFDITGALSENSRISVTINGGPRVFTNGLSGNGTAANFTSDNLAYGVVLNDSGEAELVAAYTVTWTNWDGTVLETDVGVPYGTMPEYNGETPTKPEDVEFNYDFAGWSPDVAPVTGNVTYTAYFNAVDNGNYLLYYTLDSDLDDDLDLFHDYPNGAEVTVSVWLKPAVDCDLQAFDIFIRNDTNLTRINVDFQYGQLVTEGSGQSTETLTRIIVIGDDPDSVIQIPMTAGDPVLLGTITYRIDDGVIYGQQMPITILTSSNIAVSGTPESFSPGVRRSILGAEVNQTYIVSYDDNVDGVDIPVPANQTKLHGIDLTLSQTYPVRDGYSFVGWTLDPDSGIADYAPGDVFSIDADTTLYAIWTRTVFTVRWFNGSTLLETNSFPIGSIPVYNGAEPKKPSTVLYTYTFVGWNTDPNADAPLAALPNVTDDIDFYAVFEEHVRLYTVTWMTQDGSQVLAVTEHPYGETPEYPNTLPEPTKPMDAMYTYAFDGWSELMNQEHGETVPAVRGDMTLYAAFTPVPRTYTATLMGNGGSPETQIVDVVYGEPAITLPENVSRPGYTFTGWNTEPDGSGQTVTEVANLTENVTYYAQWTPIVYTLHYDPNGGSGTVPDTTFTYEDIVEILGKDAFTKPGAEFKLTGWNTQADGQGYSVLAGSTQEGSYLAGLGVDGNNVITLYAQWTDKEYIIEYDLVGGTLLGNNPNGYTHSDVYAVAVPYVPTRDGFTFEGWLVSSDDPLQGNVTLEYHDGSWWIPAGTIGNLYFIAMWTADAYEITFTDNGTVLRATVYTTTTIDCLNDLYVAEKDGYTFTGWRVIAGEGSWEVGSIKPYDFPLNGSWGNVTLEAVWEVKEYTISFINGIDLLGTARYTIESTDTLGQLLGFVPTKDGYFFSGWLFENESVGGWIQNTVYGNDQSVAGRFGNINLFVQWTIVEYTITFVHSSNILGSAVYGIETNRTLEQLRNFELPERLGYTFAGWHVETPSGSWLVQTYDEAFSVLGSFGDVVLYTTWTLNDYTITFHSENADIIEAVHFNVETESIIEPAVPDKAAYTGVWGPYYLNLPQDQDVYPVYTPIVYTITFDVDGGTPIDPMTYTIESTDVLPDAFKGLFSFVEWTVTEININEGNWVLGSAINAGTALTGRYGDVTLQANWSFEDNVRYSIEEYKYAPTGYVMLLIADNLADGQIYTFDGNAMYYTTDANYLLDANDTGVYFTLIPYEGNVNMNDMSKLTEAGAMLVGIADAERVTITYDGNINMLDDVVNIADANAVFQMLAQPTIGGYYSIDQLSIQKRLGADMVTESYNTDHRGSIEDVHAIVEIVRNSIGE